MDITYRDLYHPWWQTSRPHRGAHAFYRFFKSPVAEMDNPAEWVPAVDIKEESERFVIQADVPGVDVKDLEITMTENVLLLQGTRESRSEESEDGFRHAERIRGRFQRSFSLPDTTDPNRIAANYQNGVLEISVPKQERAEPKRIEIKSS